jgi:hypothetical protein
MTTNKNCSVRSRNTKHVEKFRVTEAQLTLSGLSPPGKGTGAARLVAGKSRKLCLFVGEKPLGGAKSLQYADAAVFSPPQPPISLISRPQGELEPRCFNTDQHLSFLIKCPRDARVAQCLDIVLSVG